MFYGLPYIGDQKSTLYQRAGGKNRESMRQFSDGPSLLDRTTEMKPRPLKVGLRLVETIKVGGFGEFKVIVTNSQLGRLQKLCNDYQGF